MNYFQYYQILLGKIPITSQILKYDIDEYPDEDWEEEDEESEETLYDVPGAAGLEEGTAEGEPGSSPEPGQPPAPGQAETQEPSDADEAGGQWQEPKT